MSSLSSEGGPTGTSATRTQVVITFNKEPAGSEWSMMEKKKGKVKQ